MSFNPNDLGSDPIQRVRLLTGDVGDDPILDDNVYEFQILQYNNEIDAAIVVLENIISYITVNPQQEKIGNVEFQQYELKEFEKRRRELINKKVSNGNLFNKAPVIIKSDRKDWNDFEFLKYKK